MKIYIGDSKQVNVSSFFVLSPETGRLLWDRPDAVPFIMDFYNKKLIVGDYRDTHTDLMPIIRTGGCVAGRYWSNAGVVSFYDDGGFMYPSSNELNEIVRRLGNKISGYTIAKSLGRFGDWFYTETPTYAIALIPVSEYIAGHYYGDEEQADFMSRCRKSDIIDLNKPQEEPQTQQYSKYDKFPGNSEYEKRQNWLAWNGMADVVEGKHRKKIIISEEQARKILMEISAVDIDERANEANTEPTDAQKEAGNYKMGHIWVKGMQISIENPKGSYRKYKDKDGKVGYNLMHNHYGYFNITKGKDGDAVDVFIGPDIDDFENVYCIDQNKKDGSFDETKVMLGFTSKQQAKDAYLSNYSSGFDGFRDITCVTLKVFKRWLYRGRRQRQPFKDYVYIQKKKLNEGKK